MGALCYFLSHGLVGMNKFVQLGLDIVAGVLAYALFCIIFRVREMQELWNWVVRRKKI
jgi:hypothetical protein